jgi:hypothetical protein
MQHTGNIYPKTQHLFDGFYPSIFILLYNSIIYYKLFTIKYMGYRFWSIQQVLELFEISTSLSAADISKKLGKSTVIIHKYLRHLVETWVLEKKWVPPHTKYQLRNTPWLNVQKSSQIPSQEYPEIIIDYKSRKILDESFLKFTPTGEKLAWFQGMQVWCKERNLSFVSKAAEYVSIYAHLESIRNPCGAIDGTKYIKWIFPSSAIDTLLYMDQYTWMDFGRWKLAELAYFAKQSQNKVLIQNTLQEVLPKIECILSHQKIDAIWIIPWSIERKNQLLGNLKQALHTFWIPQIQIIKYSTR